MDETRRFLKTFGVAVTDFEAEAARLVERLQSSDGSNGIDALKLLKDLSELCGELNARCFEIHQRIHDLQKHLFSSVAEIVQPDEDQPRE